MSLANAGNVFLIAGLEGSAGLLTARIMELLFPPIKDQSPLRLYLEGMLQLGAITYMSIEVSKVVMRVQADPTKGFPFFIGLVAGMPNTIAKLGATGKIFTHYATVGFSEQQEENAVIAQQLPSQ